MSKQELSPEQIKKLVKTLEILESSQGQVGEPVQALLKNLVDVIDSDQRHIVRTVVFPETYSHAGIALLHYFGWIAERKLPEVPLRISVAKQGNLVKFMLEMPESHRAALEAMLETYGQVLRGLQPLTALVKDEEGLMGLKQKLDLSALELRITKDLLEDADATEAQTIQALEEDVKKLHKLVGEGVCGLYHLNELLHLSLEKDHKETRVALKTLQTRLAGKIQEKDEQEVKDALQVIMTHDPKVFDEIHSLVTGHSISGATGGFLSSWISSLSGLMPR